MLGDNKGILDNPRILREEAMLKEPVKKGKRGLFKLILFLIVLLLVFYLFMHPEIIRGSFDNMLGNLLK